MKFVTNDSGIWCFSHITISLFTDKVIEKLKKAQHSLIIDILNSSEEKTDDIKCKERRLEMCSHFIYNK